MSRNLNTIFDPVRAAVSRAHDTLHIVGDDDGEHFMGALAQACNTATSEKHLSSIASIQPVHTTDSATLTLADVPYQFLRLEVDEHSQLTKPPGECLSERFGLMSEYFTHVNSDGKGLWHHHGHDSPAFHKDFPASADNIDCNSLVADLEEVNYLLDRKYTVWVLWAAVSRAHPEQESSDGSDSAPAFDSRRRIMSVKDLVEFLNEVRKGLAGEANDEAKGREETASAPSLPTIYFIVAASHMRPPTSMSPYEAVMNLVAKAKSQPFYQETIKRYHEFQHESDSSEYYSSSSSSGGDDEEDEDYFGSESGDAHVREDAAARHNRYIEEGLDPSNPHMPTSCVVRYDEDGNAYYVRYHSEQDRQYAKTNKQLMAAKDKLYQKFGRDRVLSHFASEGSASASASASTGRQTPDGSSSTMSLECEELGSAHETDADVEDEVEEVEEVEAEIEDAAAAPRPLSILETLDTNAAKGDAVEGDLHALLPEAHSPTDQQWRECCELLCIHPDEHKDAQKRSVKIPGTDNMMVKPSQLWTAYWMLASRLDRNLCGGVLADVMGTGKTYVVLVVCLLRAYIAYNRAEVEREWQLSEHESGKGGKKQARNIAPKQHLPRNTTNSGNGVAAANTPCSCNNAMGIECFANPGGITRRLAERMSRGAALVLAPQTVLDNWVKTIKAIQLQPKYYEPVVFNAKMTKEDIVLAPALRLKQKLQMEVRPQPHISGDGLFPQAWVPNVQDAAYSYTPSIAKDAYPERFLLFATHMPEKLADFFQLPVPLRRKAGAGARERKTVYGCPIGIQFVDEFHKAKNDVIALAQHHKHLQSSNSGADNADNADNFDFWAITGTPLPARLTDLESIANIVQRLPEWDDPGSKHHGSRVAELRKLQEAYEKAIAEDGTAEQASEFRTRAEKFFQGGLIKRHTEASTFFGNRIFNLQDISAKVVVHTTPDALKGDVAKVAARVGAKLRESMAESRSVDPNSSDKPEDNWGQAVRSSSLFNHMMDLEILTTFPGAAPLMLASPPVIDFSLAAIRGEIRKVEDHDVTKVELFQKHLDTVIQGSPHMATIMATLDQMSRNKQKRRALPTPVTADSNARSALPKKKLDTGLKKLVILCPRMGEAVFVYLALLKLRPEFKPVFLHADLKLAERTALLQDFNKLDAPTPAGVVHCARVLVGTFRDAGTGNDLTVANYQILTGPLRLRSQQDQAFGRTNREGQTLKLHHQLLVGEDSPVDRIVMVTQARRRIASDPFDMDEQLELAAVEE